jgi:hypothetical protein
MVLVGITAPCCVFDVLVVRAAWVLGLCEARIRGVVWGFSFSPQWRVSLRIIWIFVLFVG